MYSPAVTARARAHLEESLAERLPSGLTETPVAEIPAWTARLADVFDKSGTQTRALTEEESDFILTEQLRSKIDYAYWAERYCWINLEASTIGPLYPLWESQRLILAEVGRLEEERLDAEYPDGVLVDILKARQLGCSTLVSSMLAHRLTNHPHVFGLLASDVPDNSAFLYDIFERIVDHLAWWMKPGVVERVKNDEMVFVTDSRLFVGASKSTRGADKTSRSSVEGRKGQLGRGRTISLFHLSEIATWTNPQQIDSSFLPTVPYSPSVFGAKESTAQGWGPKNWWYQDWQLAKSSRSRTRAIFIPWYAERSKYWLPAPLDWSPSDDTLAHARRAEESGPRWMHRPVQLTRNQLYWYETRRAEADAKDSLGEFLQEYPADDEEAFQLSGKSIFSVKTIERVRTQARPLVGMVAIKPNRQLGV
jgi:hypothetical protein